MFTYTKYTTKNIFIFKIKKTKFENKIKIKSNN